MLLSAGAPVGASVIASLAPPTDLQLSAGYSDIKLTWANPSQSTSGVQIERTLDDVTFQAIATLPPGATSYDDKGLAADTDYSYFVSEADGSAQSIPELASVFTTPTPPTNLAATLTTQNQVNEVDLAWSAAPGATQYFITRTDSKGTSTILGAAAGGGYADTTALPGDIYTYTVTAAGVGTSDSPPSSPLVVATPAAAVSSLKAIVRSSSEMDLSWEPSRGALKAPPMIYDSTNGVDYTLLTPTGISPARTSFAVKGLAAHTTTLFEVMRAGSMQSWFATTQAQTLPAVPTSLAATATTQGIQMSWSGDDDPSVAFQVYRQSPGSSDFALLDTTIASTYTDASAIRGQTYRYKIRAVDTLGMTSAFSQTAAAKAMRIVPEADVPVTDLYVNGATGSDMNSGLSEAMPFATIQAAADAAAQLQSQVAASGQPAPKVTVLIASGIYRETVTVSSNNTIFEPEPGADVTVSGLNAVTGAWASSPGASSIANVDLSAAGALDGGAAGQSASLQSQPVLGPSTTTPTDQVFYRVGDAYTEIPESRYPENPYPGLNETANQIQDDSTAPADQTLDGSTGTYETTFQIPDATQISATGPLSEPGTPNFTFADPNLSIFGSNAAAFLTGALIHILPGEQVPFSVNDGLWARTPGIVQYSEAADVEETGTIQSVSTVPGEVEFGVSPTVSTINSISETGNTVTVSATGTFAVGEPVTIADVAAAVAPGQPHADGFDGTFVVTSAGPNTFTYIDPDLNLGVGFGSPSITYTVNATSDIAQTQADQPRLTLYPSPGDYYYLSNFNSQVGFINQLNLGNEGGYENSFGIPLANWPAYVIDNTDADGNPSGDLYLHVENLPGYSTSDVEVKVRDVGFDLSGDANVTIKGIRLVAATVVTNDLSQDARLVGITAEYLSGYDRTGQADGANLQAVITRTSQGLGYAPITGYQNFISGIELLGRDDQLLDSTVEYCNANAVTIGYNSAIVSGCTIHDVDTMAGDNAGICAWYWSNYLNAAIAPTSADPILITHNTIYDSGRGLIVHRDPEKFVFILGNDLYNYGLQTTDCGATYTHVYGNGFGSDQYSRLAFNLVHDNFSVGAGLYIDNGTHEDSVDHNMIYNVVQGINDGPPQYGPGQPVQANTIDNNTIDQSPDQSSIVTNLDDSIGSTAVPAGQQTNFISPYASGGLNSGLPTPPRDIAMADLDSVEPNLAGFDDLWTKIGQTEVLGSLSNWVIRTAASPIGPNFELKNKATVAYQNIRLSPGAIPFGTPIFTPGSNVLSVAINPISDKATLTFPAALLRRSRYEIYRIVGNSVTALASFRDNGSSSYSWTDSSTPANQLVEYVVYTYAAGTRPPTLTNGMDLMRSDAAYQYSNVAFLSTLPSIQSQ